MNFRFINRVDSVTRKNISYHKIINQSISGDIVGYRYASGIRNSKLHKSILNNIYIRGKSLYETFDPSTTTLNDLYSYMFYHQNKSEYVSSIKDAFAYESLRLGGNMTVIYSLETFKDIYTGIVASSQNFSIVYLGRFEDARLGFVIMLGKLSAPIKGRLSLLKAIIARSYNIYKNTLLKSETSEYVYYTFYNESIILDPLKVFQDKNSFTQLARNHPSSLTIDAENILKLVKVRGLSILNYMKYIYFKSDELSIYNLDTEDALEKVNTGLYGKRYALLSIDLNKVGLENLPNIARNFKMAIIYRKKSAPAMTVMLLIYSMSTTEINKSILDLVSTSGKLHITLNQVSRIVEIYKAKPFEYSLYSSLNNFDNANLSESYRCRSYRFEDLGIKLPDMGSATQTTNSLMNRRIPAYNIDLNRAKNTIAVMKSKWRNLRDAFAPHNNELFAIRSNFLDNKGKTPYYTNAGDKLIDLLVSITYKDQTLEEYIKFLYDANPVENSIFNIGDAPGAWSLVLNDKGYNVRTMSLTSDPSEDDYQALTYKPAVYGMGESIPWIKVVGHNLYIDNTARLADRKRGDIFRNIDLYDKQQNMFLFSDAAVGTEADFAKQEEFNERLVITVLDGIKNGVKLRGVGIVKAFTIVTKGLRKAIIETSRYYNSTQIVKPINSRATNSEIYILYIDRRVTPYPTPYVTDSDILRSTINFMDSTSEQIGRSLTYIYNVDTSSINLRMLSLKPPVPEYLDRYS